uniref:Non-specific serine/threonine protein kinase n=1 Tax=Zooxanthella nutricula TaxID=1333877 RepID=A0A7S2L2Z8_9DINO
MLSGKPPFWGDLDKQLRRMNKERYPMSDEFWQTISAEAKDLISGLLRADPEKRLPIDEVLAHPWLDDEEEAEGEVVQKVLSLVHEFSKSSPLASICAAAVAKQLDHRSLKEVSKVFSDMDTNGDGVLELAEVHAGFERLFGPGSPELRDIDEVFSRLDFDGSGCVSYTEFCAAGLNIADECACSERDLQAAFKTFDVNNHGCITLEDFGQVVAACAPEQASACSELFAAWDGNQDGAIDFGEWLRLMRGSKPSQVATRDDGNPVVVPLVPSLEPKARGPGQRRAALRNALLRPGAAVQRLRQE